MKQEVKTISSIQPQFRSIDGFTIRFAESEDPGLDAHALLLCPSPESVHGFLNFVQKMKTKEDPELFLFTFFISSRIADLKAWSLLRIYAPGNRKDAPVSNETMQAQAPGSCLA